MTKLAFSAALATMFLGAAGAQAHTVDRQVPVENYVALAPSEAVAGVVAQPDQKVMGLSVPNGFREPAPVDERARPL